MYEEDSSENLAKENIDFTDDDSVEQAEDYELEQAHRMQNKYSLDVRRAIEDHLEESRLRKEFDYLYNDEFGAEGDE